jgi:glucose/arabinose dehydrogenase
MWVTEHGPRGGDELNHLRSGADYGWPTVTYGINYTGEIITPTRRAEDMEQPMIATSGFPFYRSFPIGRTRG